MTSRETAVLTHRHFDVKLLIQLKTEFDEFHTFDSHKTVVMYGPVSIVFAKPVTRLSREVGRGTTTALNSPSREYSPATSVVTSKSYYPFSPCNVVCTDLNPKARGGDRSEEKGVQLALGHE